MSSLFRIAATLTAAAAAVGIAESAQALPLYAQRESKNCVYCHVKPSGGVRNYRGKFYRSNNHTFAGFDDAAEAAKADVPIGPEPTPLPKSYSPPTESPAAPPAKEEAPAAAPETQPAASPSEAPEKPALPLAQAKADAAKAESEYVKDKKSAAKRTAFAQALAELGRSTTADTSLPPVRRYPAALRHYRRALALDPKNKMALDGKKQIEDVYKSMNRPIPK